VLTPREQARKQEHSMSDVVWVQMTISISGGRADGRNWPDRWAEPIDLPAAEAWPLIRAGNAVQVDAPERPAAPLPPPASATPVPRSEPAATARGPVVESSWGLTGPSVSAGSGDGAVSFSPGGVIQADPARLVPTSDPDAFAHMEPAGEPHVSMVRENAQSLMDIDPPKPAAPKADWVNYAMAHGETEDDANMQTKAALMQKYGGRL
jgi:hypothetical protein